MNLADETGRFIQQQRAVAQARVVVRDTDKVLADLSVRDPQVDDDGADLAERTASVLAAYRELTDQLSD